MTEELKSQESDIIYKLKNRDIYFLIEHQTKVDYTMPLRILKYEHHIMENSINPKKLGQKGYKLPLVISIVLYSGRRKWNVKEYIREVQDKLEGYQELEYARYNLVDINNFSEKQLLEEKTLLSKAMLIEKMNDVEKLVECLKKIVTEMKQNGYEKEQKELLITIIDLVLRRKIGQEVANDLIGKLKEKGGGEMLAVLEMIDEENKRIFKDGEKKGRKEGIQEKAREDAKKLLEKDIDIDIIVEVTGLKKEEIEKL